MKKGIWRSDWFAGLTISLLIIFLSNWGTFDGIERNAYDLGVKATAKTPSDRIAVIAIDDVSIANIGRWPWPRDIQAEMHHILRKSGAKVIGQTTLFVDPQIDPGLHHIQDLLTFYASSTLSADLSKIKNRLPADLRKLEEDLASLGEQLMLAEQSLNTDQILALSLEEDKNVVLAMHFSLGQPIGRPDAETPDYIKRNILKNITNDPNTNPQNNTPLPAVAALFPIQELSPMADSIGALNAYPDIDGAIRSEPLVIDFFDEYYPSLPLVLAARSLNLNLDDIKIKLGEGVQIGNLYIRTDANLQMRTFFYNDVNGIGAFQIDSFFDVLQGKIPASKYKDKIVLIGATATGVGDSMVTPIDSSMAPVVTLAHSVSSILNEDFFIQPEWSEYARLGISLFLAIYIILLLPRMSAGVSASFTILLLAGLLGTHYVMMTQKGMWLELMSPAILLLAGHLLLTTKRYLLTEQGKIQLDAESAESNRMLGLSLQGQGQLDSAFEKFRKLPANKEAFELLYNLALDFERKRQFNKAGSVYAYIGDHDPKFRDIKQRTKRATAMEETVILGGSSSSSVGGNILAGGDDVQKPMLGRYQIEKELGKGAMGAVYLGKDPKISRVVAIKTMALAQEFEGDELQDVKDRFFREAETAGRLSHPNIVTIYDAGEEHDLAYIAMEFLKGHDLVRYGKADGLLPVTKVLSIIARAAEALSYAHEQSVVHRDIKPANIMYEPESDTVKITDFGIARITDSSKTKTGMVLGTPSYMSPEQLAGKKVDGQSDLFSLGVMLFQMMTGRLPFQGDSMATLMYKIANEAHPEPSSLRPGLPKCITIVINRSLAKDKEKRYKNGAQMSTDLRKCRQIILQAQQKKKA
ncbi:MAG: serine/threonine-protein kinase [Gammaproteobacteria bacterium]|nr:serine/threonine-protein kinase [Gammaproteobacteria bacterium]MCW8911538.1 serine/threonine-protein kinase [Gammaproteobacteria bacterium]MCW9005112.1 serine/threonine-protein kinase [Gammaproteobacteria bacterium]MCW9055936.1 serine/threonine-protein kinase [Gammaproteobacteria bacterium]